MNVVSAPGSGLSRQQALIHEGKCKNRKAGEGSCRKLLRFNADRAFEYSKDSLGCVQHHESN